MLISDVSLKARSATIQDLTTVKKFLNQANLPTERIEDQIQNFILLLNESGTLIGCAGLETYENLGLIRSVAIAKNLQNKHLGSFIVNEIEDLARKKQLNSIYLLTETAEKFFTKHGYIKQDRSIVPFAIQQSFEYASSCKISALVMKKDL